MITLLDLSEIVCYVYSGIGTDVFNNCLFIDNLKSEETSSIDILTVEGE